MLNRGKEFLQSRMDLAHLVSREVHITDVYLDNKRHSIDSWPYAFRSVRLAVVVIIPRHSFWGPMDYYTRITWISLPLLSLGVVIIGCSLIYLLVEQVQAEEKLRTEIQRQSEAKRRAEASRDAKTNFLSSMRYAGHKLCSYSQSNWLIIHTYCSCHVKFLLPKYFVVSSSAVFPGTVLQDHPQLKILCLMH